MFAPTPFFTEGGASSRILGLVRGLQELQIHPQVVTYPSGRNWPGVDIVRPHRSERQMGIGLDYIRPLYDLEMLRKVLSLRMPRRTKVHAFMHEGAALAHVLDRLRGHPFLLDLQGSFVEEIGRTFPHMSQGAVGRLGRAVEARLERSAAQVIVSSPGLFTQVTEKAGIDRDRCHLVPDGVAVEDFPEKRDADRSAVQAWRARWGLSMEHRIAIYVGGLSPQQGIDDVIRLAPKMIEEEPLLRFLLFGRPSQLNQSETYLRQVRDLGLQGKVFLPGPLFYEQLPAALRGSDIGLTWKVAPVEEANGKIPIYMAAGLPTVAIRLPASEYYLGRSGENGGILTEKVEGAADAVVRLARDPSLGSSMGASARRVAMARFGLRPVAEQVAKLYEKLD